MHCPCRNNKDEMVTQDLPLQEPLASEVAGALIDLAQLSEQVGSSGFHGLGVLANQMLKRLLALCGAQIHAQVYHAGSSIDSRRVSLELRAINRCQLLLRLQQTWGPCKSFKRYR
jgi:hypothetical protein